MLSGRAPLSVTPLGVLDNCFFACLASVFGVLFLVLLVENRIFGVFWVVACWVSEKVDEEEVAHCFRW